MRAEGDVRGRLGPRPEVGVSLGERRNGADADLVAVEEREPLLERARSEGACELVAQYVLAGVVLPRRERRQARDS